MLYNRQIELDALLSAPVLMTGLTAADALLKPGLIVLSSLTQDTVTHHNSWMTLFITVPLRKMLIFATKWQGKNM